MTTEADIRRVQQAREIVERLFKYMEIEEETVEALLAYGAEREAAGVARGRKEMREETLKEAHTMILPKCQLDLQDPTPWRPALLHVLQGVRDRIAALPDHRPAPTEGDAT